MIWMMLTPRELDAFRDGVIRARKSDVDTPERNTLIVLGDAPYLQRDELQVAPAVMDAIKRWSKDWKSPYHAALKAIVSANDRHND